MSDLARLPETRSDTWLGKAENAFGLLVLANGTLFAVLFLLAGAKLVSASTVGPVVVATFVGIWAIPFVAIVTSWIVRAAAESARQRGDLVRYLRIGTSAQSKRHAAWLAVARAFEARGALADAAEALRRGLQWKPFPLNFRSDAPSGLVTEMRALRAFAEAVSGDPRVASLELAACRAEDLVDPRLAAEAMRARIMIAHREGRWREVVDRVNEARARRLVRDARDDVLFASLEHRAMTALEPAHPMRIAHDDAAEAWLEAVAPALARRARP